MSINFGKGGSARCVLVPPFRKKNSKIKNINKYVSKIAIYNSDLDSLEDYILFNEYNIGEYVRKHVSKQKINKYFSFVEYYDILNYDDFDYDTIKKCMLEKGIKYVVLYSKNGSCNKIKVNDNVIVNNTNVIVKEILKNNYYKVAIDKYEYKVHKDMIKMYCGNLSNYYSYFKCFNTIELFKKNAKHLLNGMELLFKNNIIHTDIKLENIVCDNNGNLRIIDYGGAINLSTNFTNTKMCLLLEKTLSQKNLYYNTIKTYTYGYIPPEIPIFLKIIYFDIYNLPINKQVIIDDLVKFNLDIHELDINNIIEIIIKNKQYLYNNLYCNDVVICKFDIYSLGIVFKKIYNELYKDKRDYNLEDLITKMTHTDYNLRYSYNEINNHAFFKKKKLSKKIKR